MLGQEFPILNMISSANSDQILDGTFDVICSPSGQVDYEHSSGEQVREHPLLYCLLFLL